MLPPDCQIVWELGPRRSTEEIERSLAIWKEHFGA
jgi:hypothetical protein